MDAEFPTVLGQVREILTRFGLQGAPDADVQALASTVRRLRRPRTIGGGALAARQKQQALVAIDVLLRDGVTSTRTDRADAYRTRLLRHLDSLGVVVKLAATTGFNAAPLISSLRAGVWANEELEALRRALESLKPGRGAAPPNARFLSLLRGGVMVWEACGRPERYTFNQYSDPATLEGPLPEFLRALIGLAPLAVPSDEVLHRHLRGLKHL